jgi:hypothetical protein
MSSEAKSILIVIATFQELEKAMENITQVLEMLHEANLGPLSSEA